MVQTLAVLFDFGSATPLDIGMSADGLCDLVFVADLESPHVVKSLPLLEAFGAVLPVADTARTVDALRRAGADGIVTFGDAELVPAARLAESLGLPFHSVQTATVLADKFLQRARLSECRVPGVRFAAVEVADHATALAEVGTPAVLKPRRGAGSRNAVLVRSEADLAAALPACLAAGDHELVLEECLVGDPEIAGKAWGDYVSVESIALGGRIHHLGVTGKPPLAEPFRETGAFFPSTLADDVRQQACEMATHALRAMDVTTGVTHTELKLTADGPRVIEVNGRLGGYVNDVYSRSAGVSLLRLAMRAALGTLDDVSVPVATRVAYQFCVTPPTWAVGVRGISGVEATRALPGVQRVDLLHQAGDRVDWRRGTSSAVAVVHGEAPDHDALESVKAQIEHALVVEYSA